jgi:large subunit ribosomal protein L15
MPLHRRIPKRGFHNPFRTEYAVVNLDVLEQRFDAGTVVTPELLLAARLIPNSRQPIKVLGRGDIAKKLTVHAHKFSGKAAEKIAAAGGAAEVLAPAPKAADAESK